MTTFERLLRESTNHIFMIASTKEVCFFCITRFISYTVFVELKEVFIFQKDLITSLCLLFCVKEHFIL